MGMAQARLWKKLLCCNNLYARFWVLSSGGANPMFIFLAVANADTAGMFAA
jgi:hypothetical protein